MAKISIEVPDGERCDECPKRTLGAVYGFINYCSVFQLSLRMKNGSWMKCQSCTESVINIEQEEDSGFW